MEKIVKLFIGLFGGLTTTILGKRILVFIISLMPILELRGGITSCKPFRSRFNIKLHNCSNRKCNSNTIYTLVYGSNIKMDENNKTSKKNSRLAR